MSYLDPLKRKKGRTDSFKLCVLVIQTKHLPIQRFSESNPLNQLWFPSIHSPTHSPEMIHFLVVIHSFSFANGFLFFENICRQNFNIIPLQPSLLHFYYKIYNMYNTILFWLPNGLLHPTKYSSELRV